MTYKTLGYTSTGDILFAIDDKMFTMSGKLPKVELCFDLGIDAKDINRDLRNKILNDAKAGGKYRRIYVTKEDVETPHRTYLDSNDNGQYAKIKWVKAEE